jgi:putative molybdopterin biosynthesis protein
MNTGKALTPSEVADRLQVAKNTVYELIKRGELKGYRVGNQVRVNEADLEAYRGGPMLSGSYGISSPNPAPAFVLSGQDPVLDLLARAAEERHPGVRIYRSPQGSYQGLTGLYLGTVQAASSHLWDRATQTYNRPFIPTLVPGVPTLVYRVLTRTVGWYVPRGNPQALAGWEDLARPELSWGVRERGSGIRVLMDAHRSRLAVADLKEVREVSSHLSAAAAVARGEVDSALGAQKAATLVEGIDFLPLQTEEYDLVFTAQSGGRPEAQALVEVLNSPEFQREVGGLGGYGTQRMGDLLSHG